MGLKQRLGKAIYRVRAKYFPKTLFKNSEQYWIDRYKKGGDSGAGSYNNLAAWKAEIINAFIAKEGVKSVIELGCGDGNQLGLLNIPEYKGFDISSVAIELCKSKFKTDATKTFFTLDVLTIEKSDLTMSLDVVYHLIEDEVYEQYMSQLFSLSNKFVIVYSINDDVANKLVPHVKPRKFTNWIEKKRPEFELIQHIPNKYPFDINNKDHTSFADFYIFKKNSD